MSSSNNSNNNNVVNKAQKQLLQDGITTLLKSNFDADTRVCIQTLMKLIDNILHKPGNDKVRSIRLNNPTFASKVGQRKGGIEFLLACGFAIHKSPAPLLSSSSSLSQHQQQQDHDQEDSLVLLPKVEDTTLLITARRMLLTCATKELKLKAEELPPYRTPAVVTRAGSTDYDGLGQTLSSPSSSNAAMFDPYKGQRYDAMSAQSSIPSIPKDPSSYVSTSTEQKVLKLQQQKDQLQKKGQSKIPLITLADRAIQAFLPHFTAASISPIHASTSASASTSATTTTKSDSALIASHISKTLQKQKEEPGFTTKAMRELSKLQKQKVYTIVQLQIVFPDGSYLKGQWYPTETIGNVVSVLMECIQWKPGIDTTITTTSSSSSTKTGATTKNSATTATTTTSLLTLYVTPPRKVLQVHKTLQEEGLVPAAKLFCSWNAPIEQLVEASKITTTTTPGYFLKPHLFSSPLLQQEQQQQQQELSFPQGQYLTDNKETSQQTSQQQQTKQEESQQQKKKKTRQEKEQEMLKRMMGS